jgi:hypothetical protein
MACCRRFLVPKPPHKPSPHDTTKPGTRREGPSAPEISTGAGTMGRETLVAIAEDEAIEARAALVRRRKNPPAPPANPSVTVRHTEAGRDTIAAIDRELAGTAHVGLRAPMTTLSFEDRLPSAAASQPASAPSSAPATFRETSAPDIEVGYLPVTRAGAQPPSIRPPQPPVSPPAAPAPTRSPPTTPPAPPSRPAPPPSHAPASTQPARSAAATPSSKSSVSTAPTRPIADLLAEQLATEVLRTLSRREEQTLWTQMGGAEVSESFSFIVRGAPLLAVAPYELRLQFVKARLLHRLPIKSIDEIVAISIERRHNDDALLVEIWVPIRTMP